MRGALILALSLAMVLSPTVYPRELRYDPATRRCRVLYVGDSYQRTWRDLSNDPFLQVSPVPASVGGYQMDYIKKSMRMYIPRTKESYEGGVDLLVLSDCDHHLFTTRQMAMFKEGVVGDGQGLIMAGGFEAFGGAGWGTTWRGSSVEDVLPVECVDYQSWGDGPFFARPAGGAEDHPFVTSLPWESIPTFESMNIVIPRQASTTLLETSGTGLTSRRGPVLVYGEVGAGASLAHAPDWNPGWGAAVMNDWEYYGDYLVNMAYLTIGMAIPQDLQLSHLVRTELAEYQLQKSVTVSLLEFADVFGGNTMGLEDRLNEVDILKLEADELYLDQDFGAILEVMGDIRDQLIGINEDAVKVKDQALFWVYAVEWLVVSGTSLACGTVLWSLMVRRRAYRSAASTRFV
jgi:uncharacterized membrane protein